MNYFVYIARCADGTLYTGYTTDLERRLKEHNGEDQSRYKIKVKMSAGARYTRSRRPVKFMYSEQFFNRSEAMKREAEIKKLTKSEKELVIKNYKQSFKK